MKQKVLWNIFALFTLFTTCVSLGAKEPSFLENRSKDGRLSHQISMQIFPENWWETASFMEIVKEEVLFQLICACFYAELGEESPISLSVSGEATIALGEHSYSDYLLDLEDVCLAIQNQEIGQKMFLSIKEKYLSELEIIRIGDNVLNAVAELSFYDLCQDQSAISSTLQIFHDIFTSLKEKEEFPVVSRSVMPESQLHSYPEVEEEQDICLFYNLRLTHEDQKRIDKLIHQIAKTKRLKLLSKAFKIKRMGRKLECIHPLRFMAYVAFHPHLSRWMVQILDDRWKRMGFMRGFLGSQGLSERLDERKWDGDLIKYLPGFCHFLGIDLGDVYPFVDKEDWLGLFYFVCKH